jgi:hydroxymethylpyrimidine pyrophosphatase-like HAD family hydrolase
LIAFDVDKTILAQHERERPEFLENLASQLVASASLGADLAFLTGNSMHELTTRFLDALIHQLCLTERLELLPHFHFFCNGVGVYVNFSNEKGAIKIGPLHRRDYDKMKDKFLRLITYRAGQGEELAIKPCFIDCDYIRRCEISEDNAVQIETILDEVAQEYVHDLEERTEVYRKIYDIDRLCKNGKPIIPRSDRRIVEYGSNSSPKRASVQITLKPILSFRHAAKPTRLFGKDARSRIIGVLQTRLDRSGLGQYRVRPGGRSSIDITLERLDKAYALEFLIDRLNLQGLASRGQELGSNAIYFGDEVIVGGGNDYPVTRIPGLLVFAVNPDRELVPFLSDVFVPSTILEGPAATADVLIDFNRCAQKFQFDFEGLASKGDFKNALEVFKVELFSKRVREKIANLKNTNRTSVEDWQTLHALVTLMCRNDAAAKRWLSILVKELDDIMTQLQTHRVSIQRALGTSHPDERVQPRKIA